MKKYRDDDKETNKEIMKQEEAEKKQEKENMRGENRKQLAGIDVDFRN